MGQSTGKRIAHHMKEPTTIDLDVSDAAVVIRPGDGVSVYLPDLENQSEYPEHVFSILAFLISLDDAELRDIMQARLKEKMAVALGDVH